MKNEEKPIDDGSVIVRGLASGFVQDIEVARTGSPPTSRSPSAARYGPYAV